MKTIGICTSSRSEKHLMEAIVTEMNSGKYDLVAQLEDNLPYSYFWDYYDFLILPADRSELTKIALQFFHNNIPFCHYLAGSQTFSYCHDDVNRWLISLMANFCFAESPEAAENLKRVGIPKDRILVTGTSHFDGITAQDIESNAVPYSPRPFDLVLLNKETQSNFLAIAYDKCCDHRINVLPNEDTEGCDWKRWSRLEFLWLLTRCHRFISNSSAIHYEVPYINKFFGKNIKVINPSARNAERTPIDPMYCKGASAKIAKWCEEVDLEWLRTPKRLCVK